MKVLRNARELTIIVCIIGILLLQCRTEKKQKAEEIQVVVTILPLAEFVEAISGEHASITVMVPPGATPHTYEPTPAQLELLSSADVYVKVGTPIEFELVWLDKLLSMNTNLQVCDASRDIDLIAGQDHHTTNIDPHIWLSVRNVRTIIKNISMVLESADPGNAEIFQTNSIQYISRLDSLDNAILNILEDKKMRTFITYHAAWSYFARDYDLEQHVIEAENKEPSAKSIQETIEIAKQHGIRIIFASPQFNTKYAETIAHEIKGSVILVDPLRRDYIENMSTVARTIAVHME